MLQTCVVALQTACIQKRTDVDDDVRSLTELNRVPGKTANKTVDKTLNELPGRAERVFVPLLYGMDPN
jgi:hypothetical protein